MTLTANKNTMKQLQYIILILTFGNTAFAQNKTFNLSLKQAIELGMKNRDDIRSARYDVLISENGVERARKEWLPEIEGSADIRYNTKLSKTIVPAGVLGNSGPMAFSLETRTNSVYALNLIQPLYKADIINNVHIAKNDLAIEKEREIQSETDIALRITQSYLNVLLKELQYKLAKDNEMRYAEYLRMAEGKYKYGALVENDYLRAQLDYQNAASATKTQQQDYSLAISAFKYQINIQNEAAVTLTDSLESVFSPMPSGKEKNQAENRSEIRQLLLSKKNTSLQLKKARQSALPSVSLYASYATQFQYENFDYLQRDWWTPYNYVGLKITLPLTFNLKNSSTISEYRLKAKKAEFDLNQKSSDIRFEVSQALAELKNSSYNLEKSKANYELSKTIFSSNRKQFELGVFQYTAVLESEKSIATAEDKYIQSMYDYLLARFNWMKATGNIYVSK